MSRVRSAGSGHQVVRYDPSFRDQVAHLERHLWSRSVALNHRYLAWKFEENPWGDEPRLFLGLSAGKVIAVRGMLALPWEAGVGGPSLMVPGPDDFVVAPEHRGSGIATDLMRVALADAADRGFPFVVNLSAGLVTALTSLAMGWKSAGPLQPVHRPHLGPVVRRAVGVANRSPVLARIAKRVSRGDASERSFQLLDEVGGRIASRPGCTITITTTPRAEDMAALIARIGHDGRIRQVRDTAFISWRYRNPLHEYRFLLYEVDGILEGFLVLRRLLTGRSPLRTHIVDWEASDESIAAELLERAIAWGGFADLGAWNATLNSERRALLEHSGFEPAEPEMRARGLPCLLVRPTGTDPGRDWTINGRSLLDLSEWDLRLVYSMQG